MSFSDAGGCRVCDVSGSFALWLSGFFYSLGTGLRWGWKWEGDVRFQFRRDYLEYLASQWFGVFCVPLLANSHGGRM